MARLTASSLTVALLVSLLGASAPSATAEERKPAAKEKVPTMASDEEVAAALKEFKEAYKAKGLKGDDRVMQRDFAMRQINKLHHPEVIKALGKASKSSDPDVRLIAVIYLGDQKLLPHLASKYVLGAMKKAKKDIVMQMTGLQALGSLKYLGASHDIRARLKHRHFVVRKAAITAVGDIGDTRMLHDVLGILGVKLDVADVKESDKKDKDGKKTVTKEEGYSWEGAEAVVDRGEADNTKENADAKKQAEAQIAKNKAAASAGKGGGGGNSGAGGIGGMGGSGGRGGTARSAKEMIPTILRTLKKITGEEFDHPRSIRKWVREQKEWVASEVKRLDKTEKAQKAGPKK